MGYPGKALAGMGFANLAIGLVHDNLFLSVDGLTQYLDTHNSASGVQLQLPYPANAEPAVQ